jgi:tetratricopeptide (TPR) repeat protein
MNDLMQTTSHRPTVLRFRFGVVRAGGRRMPILSLVLIGIVTSICVSRFPAFAGEAGDWRWAVARRGVLVGPLVWLGQWWRVVTYAAFHPNIHRMLSVAVVLLFVGQRLEWLQGRWRTACILLVAVITGALVAIIARPAAYGYGLGFGLCGMTAALAALTGRYWRTFPRSPLKTWWFWALVAAAVWQVYQVVVFWRLWPFGPVGGAMGGALAAVAVGRAPTQQQTSRKRLGYGIAAIAAVVAILSVAAMARFWFAPAKSYLYLGGARMFFDQKDLAEKAYEKAVELDPNLYAAHLRLGHIASARGDDDGAIAAYRRAAAVGENPARAYWGIGYVFHRRGQFQQALEAYEMGLRHDSSLYALHFQIGNVLTELGRPEEAAAAYDRAIEMNDEFVDAYMESAGIYRDLNEFGKALEHLERVTKLRPHDPGPHLVIAAIHWENDRLQEALAAFEEALFRGYKDRSTIYWNMGLVRRSMGQWQEALLDMERAMIYCPEDRPKEEAMRIIEELRADIRAKERED